MLSEQVNSNYLWCTNGAPELLPVQEIAKDNAVLTDNTE